MYNEGELNREIMEEHDSGESAVKCWIKSINAIDTPRAADSMTPPSKTESSSRGARTRGFAWRTMLQSKQR